MGFVKPTFTFVVTPASYDGRLCNFDRRNYMLLFKLSFKELEIEIAFLCCVCRAFLQKKQGDTEGKNRRSTVTGFLTSTKRKETGKEKKSEESGTLRSF